MEAQKSVDRNRKTYEQHKKNMEENQKQGSFYNSLEFVEGSMMLEQPGQVSSSLRSSYGVHLAEYIGDVAPGPVPLDAIREAVSADALKEKQAAYYDQQRQALLEAAQVKYYPERLH